MKTSDSVTISNTWYMSLLEYIFMFSLLLTVNSIYWTSTNSMYSHLILLLILGTGLTLSIYSLKKMRFLQTRIMWMLLIYYLIMIPLLLYNHSLGYAGTDTFIRILLFPAIIIFYIDYDTIKYKNNILHKIVNVGVFLSIVSLFFWILKILGMNYNSSIQTGWGGIREVSGLFRLQFFPQGSVNFLGFSMLRNSGIYSEAPMFSYVLSTSLITNLFLEPESKKNNRKTIILIITLITTTSTTGLLIIIVSLLLKLYLRVPNSGKILVVLVIPMAIYVVEFVVSSKLESMGGSVNIRLDDIRAGFEAWKQKPFLGNGFDNSYSIKLFMDQARLGLYGNDGNSSGLMSMLARGGVVLSMLFFFIPIILFSKKSVRNFSFGVCFGLMFLVSIVDGTYFFIFMILWMYSVSINWKRDMSTK